MKMFYGSIEYILEGENIHYVLSAGIDLEKDDSLYMPSLSFYENYGSSEEKLIEYWDNEGYLIDSLYDKLLVPLVDDGVIRHPDVFVDVIKVPGISIKDFINLKALILKGIQNNFFKEFLTEKYARNNKD